MNVTRRQFLVGVSAVAVARAMPAPAMPRVYVRAGWAGHVGMVFDFDSPGGEVDGTAEMLVLRNSCTPWSVACQWDEATAWAHYLGKTNGRPAVH